MVDIMFAVKLHQPEKKAADVGVEFNPSTEAHHIAMLVKVVDSGCTFELQIEEVGGRVSRFTTTDNRDNDREQFRREVIVALDRALDAYGL